MGQTESWYTAALWKLENSFKVGIFAKEYVTFDILLRAPPESMILPMVNRWPQFQHDSIVFFYNFRFAFHRLYCFVSNQKLNAFMILLERDSNEIHICDRFITPISLHLIWKNYSLICSPIGTWTTSLKCSVKLNWLNKCRQSKDKENLWWKNPWIKGSKWTTSFNPISDSRSENSLMNWRMQNV